MRVPSPAMQINGAAVRAIREKAKIPQSRLAVEAQISVQYLNDLEAIPQRRKGLNPQIAAALAAALDVPVEAITMPRENRRQVEAVLS